MNVEALLEGYADKNTFVIQTKILNRLRISSSNPFGGYSTLKHINTLRVKILVLLIYFEYMYTNTDTEELLKESYESFKESIHTHLLEIDMQIREYAAQHNKTQIRMDNLQSDSRNTDLSNDSNHLAISFDKPARSQFNLNKQLELKNSQNEELIKRLNDRIVQLENKDKRFISTIHNNSELTGKLEALKEEAQFNSHTIEQLKKANGELRLILKRSEENESKLREELVQYRDINSDANIIDYMQRMNETSGNYSSTYDSFSFLKEEILAEPLDKEELERRTRRLVDIGVNSSIAKDYIVIGTLFNDTDISVDSEYMILRMNQTITLLNIPYPKKLQNDTLSTSSDLIWGFIIIMYWLNQDYKTITIETEEIKRKLERAAMGLTLCYNNLVKISEIAKGNLLREAETEVIINVMTYTSGFLEAIELLIQIKHHTFQ